MHKRRFLIIILIIVLGLTGCSLVFSEKNNSKFDKSSLENTLQTNTLDKSGSNALFHFIDVGQGDCVLIQSGDINILIDAGTSESGSVIYKYLKSHKINYLNYFIGTHPHEDHLGGAASILSSIDVGRVFLNSDTSTSYFYERFVDTLIERKITPVKPDMDCIYEAGAFRIKFLSPTKDFGDTNDNSLITMLEFGDIKALFMGDAERSVEAELIQSGKDINADILKVGHHGSRYVSSSEFLNAVYPSVAVIQCGKDNSYGHPHEETLNRLNSIDATVLRTDKDGNIVLVTDGKTIQKATGEIYEKSDTADKISLVYIGNLKSKVFHSESCPNLPQGKNRTEFSTREDAINSGYKACGNCKP